MNKQLFTLETVEQWALVRTDTGGTVGIADKRFIQEQAEWWNREFDTDVYQIELYDPEKHGPHRAREEKR